ncbi:peptidylprolyl isomerase [Nakamurella antarctica]|uniref:Peptidyl-prolyl cis-trans isomerase n=2 Tax=Nakamurella antarctica TaxID=1902245 RepID=A0A3G8ZQK7_9ACTN|nr:peptidylprolyl isomerase [Nakamurella antarctica]
MSGCSSDGGKAAVASAPSPASSASPSSADAAVSTPAAASGGAAACTYTPAGPTAKSNNPPPATAATSGSPVATMTIGQGTIALTLKPATAPCTVNSFTSLASQKYFDGTKCHRLTASPSLSVLQCGDPTATGTGGPGYEFADELAGTETYPRGTLAMANAEPGTNGSQFFLVYADSTLPPSYTVFGTITSGLEILDGIAAKGISGIAPTDPVDIASIVVQ